MPNVFRIGEFDSRHPFYAGKGVSGSIPESIPGLVIWLDASDGSTITKDGGDRVSQWNDKSGGGIDVIQLTAAEKFLWVASGVNGQPIMRADGGDIMTSAVNSELDVRNDYTIFSVAKTTTISPTSIILSTDGYTNGILVSTDSGVAGRVLQTHLSVKAYAPPFTYWNITDFFINSVVMDSSNDAHFYRDGSFFATVLAGGPAVATTTGISIGGRDSITPENWSGDIAEILLYKTALSDPNRELIETYLNDKYNIF